MSRDREQIYEASDWFKEALQKNQVKNGGRSGVDEWTSSEGMAECLVKCYVFVGSVLD